MDANTVIVNKNAVFNIFNNYQVELYINDGPKIKVHRDNEDVTQQIFGFTHLYGSLENLTIVYKVLKLKRSLF